MEKIRKIDVGTLHGYDSHSVFEDNIRKRSYMYFENGGHFDNSSHIFDLNGEHCYIVSKDELDAYMARKEELEQMNCTPVWDAYNRLKVKVNELEAENADLKEKIKELGVIKSFLEIGNEKWIIGNTELKSRNRNLELENAKLRGELSRADDELAKFHGEHTVEFLYEKHEAGKHIIGWTEVSGEEYELTFLTPERKIHE